MPTCIDDVDDDVESSITDSDSDYASSKRSRSNKESENPRIKKSLKLTSNPKIHNLKIIRIKIPKKKIMQIPKKKIQHNNLRKRVTEKNAK